MAEGRAGYGVVGLQSLKNPVGIQKTFPATHAFQLLAPGCHGGRS
jgi:hypothetical protein